VDEGYRSKLLRRLLVLVKVNFSNPSLHYAEPPVFCFAKAGVRIATPAKKIDPQKRVYFLGWG